MKRRFIVISVFLSVALNVMAQSFELPKVSNTTDSVDNAFRQFVDLAKRLGTPEYNSGWNYDPDLIVKDYTAYLESVLANMNYNAVKIFIASLRTNINKIDADSISRRQWSDFENDMQHAFFNNDYEVRPMVNDYKTKHFPFPLEIDAVRLAELDEQAAEHRRQLSEYQAQLDAIPTNFDINTRQQEIRRELLSPNVARDAKRTKQLEEESAQIERQKVPYQNERKRLSGLISDMNTQLARLSRDSYIKTTQEIQREQFIVSVWASLNNFFEWEKFFAGESTCIHDFFVLNNTKQNLYALLDEIPQGQVKRFTPMLDAFCADWGL